MNDDQGTGVHVQYGYMVVVDVPLGQFSLVVYIVYDLMITCWLHIWLIEQCFH